MSNLELEAMPQVQPLPLVQTSASAADASYAVASQAVASQAVASQLIAALVVGLLTAFALQFLLANMAIAVGISALGWGGSKQSVAEPDAADRSELGGAIAKISLAAGCGILLTISLVLFVACFLATTFSHVTDPTTGAIIGLTIWSAYFLILLWFSTRAVSSLVGVLLGSAAAGFRQMVRMISQVLSQDGDRPVTAADVNALVQQELQTALASADLRQPLVEYLETLPPPQADPEFVRHRFAELLTQLDLQSLVESGAADRIDRQTFVDLVNRRADLDASLDDSDKAQVVDQLESAWQDAIAFQAQPNWTTKLLNFIKAARPEQLRLNHLAAQLHHGLNQGEGLAVPASSLLSVLADVDLRSVMRTLLRRLDLTDLDIESIWQQLQTLRRGEAQEEEEALTFSTIQADVEDYLLHTAPWHLEAEGLEQEFREVLFDPEADPEQVRSQLEQLDADQFQTFLQQREDLEPTTIKPIVERLEGVRQEQLTAVKTAALNEQVAGLRQWFAHLLQTMDQSVLESTQLEQTLASALAGFAVSPEVIQQVLSESDRDTFYQILKHRSDLKKKEAKRLSKQLLQVRDRLLEKVDNLETQLQTTTDTLGQKLAAYLRHTKTKQLTPKGINRKLKTLLAIAQEQVVALQAPLPDLDWQALTDILSRRKGLSARQRQAILSQIEAAWSEVQQQSAALINSRQNSATQLTEQLAEQLTDYFQMVAGEALDLEDLQQRLLKGMGIIGLGDWVIRHQLSQIDWQALGDRLQQGNDWSDTHLQQLLHQTQGMVRRLIKSPRRWALRSSTLQRDLLTDIETYLHHANKVSLAPEAMQQSLHQLLQDAQVFDSQEAIATALEQLTRLEAPSILQGLSQRNDLTEAEAEAIADQFATVRQSLMEQLQTAQAEAQSSLSAMMEQLTHAFDAFDLIPPDYREITHHLGELLDEAQPQLSELNQHLKSVLAELPTDLLQGSWESVREQAQQLMGDRLLAISENAVTTLLQSQHQVSDTIRHAWLGQVELLRDRVLEQVGSIRQRVEARLETLQQQTQQRLEETRKAAALAAWWLFATTLSAGVSAAIAGIMAVNSPL